MLMKPYKRQTGFSLVELMIGLVIGLFILLGVVLVYVSSARTTATNEALSRVQESGRFGMFFLARDIRQAGFKSACQGEVNNLLDESSSAYDDALFNLDDPIIGWDDSAGDIAARLPNYLRGDVLILKSASTVSGVTASGNTPAHAGNINLTTASGIQSGQVIFVGNAQGCDIFQNTNAPNANALNRAGGNVSPGNKKFNANSNPFSQAYDNTMQIFLFESTAYYIGNGIDGQPALRRTSFNTGAAVDEELVNGIEDMQLLYGVDTDGDRTADNYVNATAVTNWNRVVSVQVNLLATSLATNVIDQPQVLPAPWDAMADPGDNRIRRVFTTTVGIRNRLP
jgi:type IV pilus assembly protein PilW